MGDVQHDKDTEARQATGRRGKPTRSARAGAAARAGATGVKRTGKPAVPAQTATMRARGGLTLPAQIREQVNLQEGDQVIVSVRDGQVVLTPATVIPRDQEWFWTPEWQAKEAEADEELARGEGTFFATDEEFLAALDRD